ncbi:hypothetical protein DRE_06747 [Drechslerella stenobrocha 248]|uniref:Mediator of RNA polymerase II transcription subunit 22 n=1 Tax=Drechslerella stenobrocha 248 TaxID=1043628 RepID=W7HN11_9PEZI|nr:hypothetical protein DRE_06747 [Drechslerella stenobrocha 248]
MENPTYTAPSQQSTALSRINAYQNNLLLRFQNIIELATADTQDLTMAATQAHQIQVHTASMIKTVEDLLTLTRALKEAWLFGQMGEADSASDAAAADSRDEEIVEENARFVIDWLKTKIRDGDIVGDGGSHSAAA